MPWRVLLPELTSTTATVDCLSVSSKGIAAHRQVTSDWQELPADAAVDIFFIGDLRPILQRVGSRGYRAVQLEAGILGGKLYLAAYAQQLGATGLTFYDDDVIRFFSPHAEGKSAIFLVAVGKRRPTQ